MSKILEGVVDVIIYANIEPGDNRKNRGFCFVDFVDHKAASDAKRRISMGKVRFLLFSKQRVPYIRFVRGTTILSLIGRSSKRIRMRRLWRPLRSST